MAAAVVVAGVIRRSPPLPAAQMPPNAGAVRTWNGNAFAAFGAAGQPPNVAVLHMAMVQGAVYDAVNSIDGGHEPLHGRSPGGVADGVDECGGRGGGVSRAGRTR